MRSRYGRRAFRASPIRCVGERIKATGVHEFREVAWRAWANRYVRYFNAKHHRTGTIWEGRFKSCLVDSDQYLFTLYKYIEMNPVKANMVKDIANYEWSSYWHNALGQTDKLITKHQLYKDLGASAEQRGERYRKIFDTLNITK